MLAAAASIGTCRVGTRQLQRTPVAVGPSLTAQLLGNYCHVCGMAGVAEWLRRLLPALSNLPAVDHPVLPLGHVVDADGAEGEAFEADARFSRVEA
jgi:hypothetical protein